MKPRLDVWRRRFAKLRAHPRPMRFVASRLLWQTRLSPLFTIDIGDGLRARFYPSSISAALWVSPHERSEDVAFLRTVLRAGDSYVDCGANIGHLALVARSVVGSGGRVVAIEPNPRICSYLRSNLALNAFTDVTVHALALGARAGVARISDRRDDDQNRVGDSGIAVAMRTLDDVVSLPRVTLLKLDVEGYELDVLRGAERVLAGVSIVYCELSANNAARFGNDPRVVERFLLERGFRLARRGGGAWELVREPIFDSGMDVPRTGYNLVAVRADAAAWFAARVGELGQRVS